VISLSIRAVACSWIVCPSRTPGIDLHAVASSIIDLLAMAYGQSARAVTLWIKALQGEHAMARSPVTQLDVSDRPDLVDSD
jgi:hypothetical protein